MKEARNRLEAREFDAAAEQVDLALALDPEYLAARVLRERISEKKHEASSAPRDNAAAPERAIVSREGFAKFEARARQRRLERRVLTARTAIAEGQLGEARAAVGEVFELDPACADLPALNDALANAEAASTRIPSRSRWFVGGLMLAAVLLCASWLEKDTAALRPVRHTAAFASVRTLPAVNLSAVFDQPLTLTEPPAPDLPDEASSPAPAPTMAAAQPVEKVVDDRVPPPAPAILAPVSTVAGISGNEFAAQPTPLPRPQQVVARVEPSNDDQLVRDTLGRYREAYARLNAKSAQEVWPGVDEPALARAFDGLESQSLTFDDCKVDLFGAIATATCRGSARYTPKVGAREPHVESRVWNFTLHKAESGWQIDAARADR